MIPVSLPTQPTGTEQPNPTNPILSTAAANQAIVNSAVAAATNPVNVISASTTTTLASLRNVVPSQIVVPQLQTVSSAFPPSSVTVIPHPNPRTSITIPDLPNDLFPFLLQFYLPVLLLFYLQDHNHVQAQELLVLMIPNLIRFQMVLKLKTNLQTMPRLVGARLLILLGFHQLIWSLRRG